MSSPAPSATHQTFVQLIKVEEPTLCSAHCQGEKDNVHWKIKSMTDGEYIIVCNQCLTCIDPRSVRLPRVLVPISRLPHLLTEMVKKVEIQKKHIIKVPKNSSLEEQLTKKDGGEVASSQALKLSRYKLLGYSKKQNIVDYK